MLNEHCVRLEKGFRLCHRKAIERLRRLGEWLWRIRTGRLSPEQLGLSI